MEYAGQRIWEGVLKSDKLRSLLIAELESDALNDLLEPTERNEIVNDLKRIESGTVASLSAVANILSKRSSRVALMKLQNTLILRQMKPGMKTRKEIQASLISNGVPFELHEKLIADYLDEQQHHKRMQQANRAISQSFANDASETVTKKIKEISAQLRDEIGPQVEEEMPAMVARLISDKRTSSAAARATRDYLESEDVAHGIAGLVSNHQTNETLQTFAESTAKRTVQAVAPIIIQQHMPGIVHAGFRHATPYIASILLLSAGTYVGVHRLVRTPSRASPPEPRSQRTAR